MIEIRYVQAEDKAFWYQLDHHLPEHEFLRKVRDGQGYILLVDGSPAGLLRYNLFWDNTPFCTLLFIRKEYQRKGLGSHMMAHWERDMKAKGYGMLLTSTQVDEEAQHFTASWAIGTVAALSLICRPLHSLWNCSCSRVFEGTDWFPAGTTRTGITPDGYDPVHGLK